MSETYADRVARAIGAIRKEQSRWYETDAQPYCGKPGLLRFRQHPYNKNGLWTRCQHGCQIVWEGHVETCERLRVAAGQPEYVKLRDTKPPRGHIKWQAREDGLYAVVQFPSQYGAILQVARIRRGSRSVRWCWRYRVMEDNSWGALSDWNKGDSWPDYAVRKAEKWARAELRRRNRAERWRLAALAVNMRKGDQND